MCCIPSISLSLSFSLKKIKFIYYKNNNRKLHKNINYSLLFYVFRQKKNNLKQMPCIHVYITACIFFTILGIFIEETNKKTNILHVRVCMFFLQKRFCSHYQHAINMRK